MSKIKKGLLAVVAALFVAMPASVLADPSTPNPQLAQQVRHELVMLPYYGVFDNLAYSINGGTVTLYGQVVRASTRSDAEKAIKRLPGVTGVKNNIKVLPLSGFDNNIRGAVYRSIARMGGLYRYLQGGNPSLHIVVDSGHVTLEGMVSSSSDKNLAYLAANQVGGIFSVTNNLRVESEQPQ
ncbi:MAG TPA: BON domain-containing protein [Pyrinomonadaceae bacterium]|nr:BON domain-containing protein [Pyrinomonadaceae bacterium]